MYIEGRCSERNKDLDTPGLEDVLSRKFSVSAANVRRLRVLRVVAEGDSWFSYLKDNNAEPISLDFWERLRFFWEQTIRNVGSAAVSGWTGSGYDILDYLMERPDLSIRSFASAGEVLENMVQPENLRGLVRVLREHANPKREGFPSKVLVFSGGGNDFANSFREPDEAKRLFHTRGSPLGKVHRENADQFFKKIAGCYETLLRTLRQEFGEDIAVFTHCYGRSKPTGKGLVNWRGEPVFEAAWLKPYLVNAGYVDEAEQREIVTELQDMFTANLKAMAEGGEFTDFFHLVDFTACIKDDWWINEYHLYNSGFKVVADGFYAAILSRLGNWSGIADR